LPNIIIDIELENITIQLPIIDNTEPINVNKIPIKDITASTPYFLDEGEKSQDISKKRIYTFIHQYKKKCF